MFLLIPSFSEKTLLQILFFFFSLEEELFWRTDGDIGILEYVQSFYKLLSQSAYTLVVNTNNQYLLKAYQGQSLG